MSNVRDPYFQARQELLNVLQKTNYNFDRWQKLQQQSQGQSGLSAESTLRSQELASLTREIKDAIKQITADLSNLQQVINVVQANRAAFPSIDDNDLNERKKLVSDVGKRIKEIDETLNAARSRAKLEADKRKELLSGPASGSQGYGYGSGGLGSRSGFDRAREADSLDLVERKRQAQMEREAKEDEVILSMSESLSRLQVSTLGIGQDLRQHKELIEGLDEEVGKAQSTMDVTLTRIDALLQKSRKGRYCCIFILFVIVVVLFFCIIYL